MQPLEPGSTIGILGAGQLGRMLAAAASQLGFKCRIYSDLPGPASDVAVATTIGAYEDIEKIAKFAEATDVVTYEFENVPVEAAAAVERVRPVRPGLKALEAAQDRYREKNLIASLGIPIARFASVSGPDLWRYVGILRTTEQVLQKAQEARSGRNRMFAVHGNRLVEWLVFQKMKDGGPIADDPASPDTRAFVEKATMDALDEVTATANSIYGTDVYLASLFKNLTKCRAIVKQIRQE